MGEVKKVRENSQLLLRVAVSWFDSESNESQLNIQPNFPNFSKTSTHNSPI